MGDPSARSLATIAAVVRREEGLAIRRAERRDLAAVSRLAGELVRLHHATDPSRFFLADRVEEGYEGWLSREIGRAEAVVLVAARGEEIAGYAYGTLEGRDWTMLLDAHGALHDVFVAAGARRAGLGAMLVRATAAALEALGARRVVLSTMVGNEAAQRVFRACGFRPTMLEMTRDAESSPERTDATPRRGDGG
jgi:ribosomal protein S18 acetylase RimI-like enzyme